MALWARKVSRAFEKRAPDVFAQHGYVLFIISKWGPLLAECCELIHSESPFHWCFQLWLGRSQFRHSTPNGHVDFAFEVFVILVIIVIPVLIIVIDLIISIQFCKLHCLFSFQLPEVLMLKVKGKVCIRAKWPTRPEVIPVSIAWSN